MTDFSNKGFKGSDFLAASNPVWLSDTFVWGKGFFIKYNSSGRVEEVDKQSITERTQFKLCDIRSASDIEILAIRQAVADKYDEEI